MENAKKRLLKYLIITFAISYLCWGGLAVLVQTSVLTFSHPIATAIHLIGGFGPTFATLFVLNSKLSVRSMFKFIFDSKKKTLAYLR